MRSSLSLLRFPLLITFCAVFAGCGGGGPDTDDVDEPLDVLGDSSGDNGGSCVDSCPEEGATDCSQGGVRTCADLDDDGCVEWSLPEACGQGLVCSEGKCVSGCVDQDCTAIGAKMCSTSNNVIECGFFGEEACLAWGNSVPCDDGLVCARGFCASECVSECTTIGAKRCRMNSVVVCGDYNTDGCLEWGGEQDCGDQFCTNGVCKAECSDECTVINSRQCELGGYVICNEYDGDGCLEWGTVLYCGQGQSCSNGFCSSECVPGCTVEGARKCQMNSVVECGDFDNDGCLEWGSPTPCDEGLVCAGGNCANQCMNDCTVAKARQCDESGAVVTCDDYNQDGCLEWGSPKQCDIGLVCSNGNCALSCSNQCQVDGARQCLAGSTTKFQVCGDYNDDSCLEWGTAQDCEGSLVCSNGECAQTCSNGCDNADKLECVGDGGWRQCRDYNDDGCLEWGTTVFCESWEECEAGKCESKEAPVKILINEIMIDTNGSPDLDSFVELWGPAGTSLSGWSLIGVNGANGDEYQKIDLVGTLGSDGLFVVAHPDSKAAIHDMGDQFSSDVDYQNGYDSIQIRYGETVVDAIAYDTFPPDKFFAGEGTAVPKPATDHSLARDLSHTDTDNNADDFIELATPTPGAANQDVNQPPIAEVLCPATAKLGESATFDASGSDDPDGSIAEFKFDFGDDSPAVSGLDSVVNHTFGAADTFTVTVTVTDNRGDKDTATCQIVVGDDNAPTVDFIKPANDTQVTQGSVVTVLVNPQAVPGRNIVRVELWADGVNTGMSDDSAPYEFTYVVPEGYPNNTSLQLQAKAVDNLGSSGFGSVRLQVKNDVPIASFTAVVSGDKQITVDASSSRDTETATADLQVRWDFTNDGTWDTDWSAEKVVVKDYPADGQYSIKMEVRDAIGQTSSMVRDVTLTSIQYVGGTVTTTTWTGTIVITGDVTVPVNETLTVAAGTSVQFVYIDQNGDQVGDYDITVNGTLIVNGTQQLPVLFTSYGTEHKHASAWNRILIQGAGSQIRNAAFEYASVALEAKKDLLVEDSVMRFGQQGFRSTASAANTTMNRVVLRENAADGLTVTSGTLNAVGCEIVANVGRGAYLTGGTFNMSQGFVRDNGSTGIEFSGGGSGLITKNRISGNAYEGVRVWTDSTTDPSPVVNYNNIVGNAVQGALVIRDVGLTVSTDSDWYGTKASGTWTNPSNATILSVQMQYSESDSSSNYVSGAVRKDSSSGTEMASASSATQRWYDVSSYGAKTIVATVSDYYSGSYYGTTTVHKAVSLESGVVREVSAITQSGVIDMRHNYFGVFPNVLDRVSLGSTTSANLHGFVNQEFDSGWSKGNCFGGETISTETTWIGTIYVTGDLTFAGTTLNVGAGTQVLFAPVDQDGNGIGDYDLNLSASTFNVNGTSGDPVRFGTLGDVAQGFQEVRVFGAGTSTIQNAIFENGRVGLTVETGTHSIAASTFRNNGGQGLWLKSNSGSYSVTVSGGLSRDNGVGVLVESFRNLSIDRMTVEYNTGNGIQFGSSTTSVGLTNCTVRNNGGDGVYLNNSTVGIDHCSIQYNGAFGVRYRGSSAGTLSYSNIKFNDMAGVLLLSSSSSPNPQITSNNIYGNSLDSGIDVASPALSVSTDSDYYGTKWSSAWSTPGGQKIYWIRASYSESDSSSNYVTGQITAGSQGGTAVFSASSASSASFLDIESFGATKLYCGVQDYYSGSYYGTTTLEKAMYPVSNVPTVVKATELAAATTTGQVGCTLNYWGTMDIQPRFSLGRSDAIDFSGFTGAEYASAGPLP